jgi:hypothetical protein
MKRFFLSFLSGWRNPKEPIQTHAELVERVAVLMERVARQDVKVAQLERKIVRWLADPLINEPNLDDFTPDGSGYLIPRAVVMHLTEAELAALKHLKTEPGVVQPLQPGEVIAPIPTPVSERPWELNGWLNSNGECWWSPRKGPAYWRMVDPTFVQAGWLLPHHAIPAIPSIEGDQL